MQTFQPIIQEQKKELLPKAPKGSGLPSLRIIIEEKKSKGIYISSLREDFFSCTCYHPDTGHFLLEGKCDYPYCNCKQFLPLNLEIRIEIRNIDLFKSENIECGSEEYPKFWLQFKEWIEGQTKNDTTKSL